MRINVPKCSEASHGAIAQIEHEAGLALGFTLHFCLIFVRRKHVRRSEPQIALALVYRDSSRQHLPREDEKILVASGSFSAALISSSSRNRTAFGNSPKRVMTMSRRRD